MRQYRNIGPEKAFEVGRQLCRGLGNPEIAKRLKMPESSVKKAIMRLCSEFDIPQRGCQRIVLAVKLSQYPIFLE